MGVNNEGRIGVDDDALTAVVAAAAPVAQRLGDAGHRTYVVGGLVRDLHLGIGPGGDIDITTDATPDVTKAVLADIADDLWTQGERFGTIGLKIGDDVFEVTTHRSEIYDPASRKPRVQFSTAIEADLSRRDFTVNAMAVEVPSKRLVDPFSGAADLADHVLRTPGAPELSFTDDPLRMLRAARFHAGYGLEPVDELVEAMTTLRDRIAIVSEERIRDELTKLLDLEEPGEGILLLARTGLLELLVDGYDESTAADVAQLVDAVSRDQLVRRAAFHLVYLERRGEEALSALLSRRRYSGRQQRETAKVLGAALHGADRAGFGADDRNVREFYAAAGEVADAATELVALERLAGLTAMARFDERRRALAETEALESPEPALTGGEVMEILDVASGPLVGAALDHLREIRLDEGPISAEEARRRVLAWRDGRS